MNHAYSVQEKSMYHLAMNWPSNRALQQCSEYIGMLFHRNLRFVLNVSTSSEILMVLYACPSGLGGLPTLRLGNGGNDCKQGTVTSEHEIYYLTVRQLFYLASVVNTTPV